MKKQLFFIVFLLIAQFGFGQVTVTYDFSAAGAVSGNNASPPIAIDGNIGFSSHKNSSGTNPAIYSGQLRLYQNATKGGSIKIIPSNGATITKVVVNGSTQTGDAGYTVDGGTATNIAASGTNFVYTIDNISATTEVEFYQREANNTNRIYVDNFVVTYTPSPNCGISNIAIANPQACNDNGTSADATDDYYTADVVVTYANAPAGGTITLTGAGIVTGGTTSASATSSPQTISGVRLKADNNDVEITASFDATCTYTSTVANSGVAPCSAGAAPCGSESFSNIPTNSSTSYQTRTWAGDNGVTWEATQARTDQSITGKAIMFRGTTGSLKNTTPVSGGCGTLSFDYKRTFSGGSTIQVLVNNTQVGGDITVSSETVNTFSTTVNTTGDITVEIKNLTSGNRVAIDNLSWTCYATPLPIELISFNPTLDKNKVNLEWITATEINNDYFTLERSKNGEDFEAIAKIKGAGNSNEKLTYNYIDAKPYQGVSYYRLKQTDFDGQFSYSKIKAIENNTLGENMDISIYPNPTEDILHIKINATSLEKDNARYFIYDNLGKLVQQNILESNESKINTSLLQKGVYQLKIVNQNIDKSLVFIKK